MSTKVCEMLTIATRPRFVRFAMVPTIFILLATLACGHSNNDTLPRYRPEVVFIGASTVEYWPQHADFPARNWIPKGVAGQTCAQVNSRFQQDVIDLHPNAVHIYCGINDMTPGYEVDTTISSMRMMFSAARASGLNIYVGTLAPWGPGWFADTNPNNYPTRNADVDALNAALKLLAKEYSATVLDYHSILSGADGRFDSRYTSDGVHPNSAGYDLMTALADSNIR